MSSQYVYLRVSTWDQSVDPQSHELLKKYPGARVISETASGAKNRPMLNALIEETKRGDRLIVAAMDRLGRDAFDLLSIVRTLETRGVTLILDKEGFTISPDDGEPGSLQRIVKNIFTSFLASFAEMEHAKIRNRTRDGIAIARAAGKQIGRPREISDKTLQRGVKLIKEGASITSAAKSIGVSYPYMSMAWRTSQNTGVG